MTSDARSAILDSRPPASDHLTYLTILESHISPAILPTLNDILQDVDLTQNIGWDLIHLLLPLPGAEQCLTTIARLGNPREVVLKVTEALQSLGWDAEDDDEGDKEKDDAGTTSEVSIPTTVDKFCTLVGLLAILLPRIKTKYPSRFLSTALIAVLANFRPSSQATTAVVSFVHSTSGKKRPPLPGRKSSVSVQQVVVDTKQASAPDPEAQEADPNEAAIQKKLLQSFVTHVLEEYVNTNPLEWSARLQEHFEPGKVVTNKASGRFGMSEEFKEKPELQIRETVVGQLVALGRDLSLSNYDELFQAIYKADTPNADTEEEEDHPTSPEDIPLSRSGCLFLIAANIFSSVLFETKIPQPELSIFPDHAKLVKQFIGVLGNANIGVEEAGVVDAVLAIGIWLEENNKFVGGPLEDEDFLQLLQSLSLLSANNPLPNLRYAAHSLTSSILHAHPSDQVRLAFISDTLEHCPFETLKASAVSWLKEEIVTAEERKTKNCFSSTVALAAVQPYLFPVTSALLEATDDELVEELGQSFPYHMAVANFLYFVAGEKYRHVAPTSMFAIVDQIYLGPLKTAVEKAIAGTGASESTLELQLLADRITMSSAQIDEA